MAVRRHRGTRRGLGRLGRLGRMRGAMAATAAMAAVAAPHAFGASAVDPLPDWCPEPEARQFDFWIGEWDVQNHNRPPDESRWARTGRATNRVYTVVGGCAVVEHWRGYAWPAAGHIAGFSVRTWDPASEEWKLVLLWPVSGPPAFGTPSGRFEDGVGRFHNRFVSPTGDTVRTRLTFSDIGDDGFTWSNGVSRDGGETWASTWRMQFTRRPRTAAGLWNGPSMSTERCPDEAHRALDRHLGEWVGARTRASTESERAGEGAMGDRVATDSVALRTHLVRILDGCAVMERTWSEDGEWEAFAVRAYEPASSRWVEYVVASDRRGVHRRESAAPDTSGELVFTDVEPVAGGFTRTRWIPADGAIHRIHERASRPEGPWSPVAETRFAARAAASGGA